MKLGLPTEEFVTRYLAGETASAIGADYGVDYHCVQRRLKKVGVTLRGRGPTEAGKRRIAAARRLPLDEQKLRLLAGQGLNCKEIAAQLEGSPSEECVRERMVALGLDRLAPKARPQHNYFWKGGLIVDADGYILQKAIDHPHRTAAGYVRQHRLVMECELGRLLLPTEVVDHVNRDTSDNRPENLRVFGSNAEHLAVTLTGVKLPAAEREKIRRAAVQRAHQRVAAILAESETGADQ